MNAIFENKEKVQLGSGIVSLVALLLYTLVHTGGLLSHYIKPPFIGYIAAFGIELAVVSLSLRIGELRRSKQSTKFFLFVLISVVAVSAMANVAEGFFTLHNKQLTLETVKQLDAMQAVIGVMATGLVSLIVLALSEIVGTDVNVKQLADKRVSDILSGVTIPDNLADFERYLDVNKKTAAWLVLRRLVWERDGKRCQGCNVDLSKKTYHCHHVIPEREGGPGKPSNLLTLCPDCHEAEHPGMIVQDNSNKQFLDMARESKARKDELTKQQRLDILLDTLSQSPEAKITELSKAAGVSRTTVYTYLDELEQQGLIERNGQGVKVDTGGDNV